MEANMREFEVYSTRVERAKRFIERNLDRPLGLEEVSREGGMSKYHFARTFKIVTGRTFKTYLNEVRIEKAKALMRNREMNISEVILEAGFNDYSYFNRVFRRHEGMSPSSYQKGFGTHE